MRPDEETYYWSDDQASAVAEKIREKLTALAKGDSRPAFDQAVVQLTKHAASATADLTELITWRTGRPAKHPALYGQYELDGDGSEEVGHAVESLGLFLQWVAWLIADEPGHG